MSLSYTEQCTSPCYVRRYAARQRLEALRRQKAAIILIQAVVRGMLARRLRARLCAIHGAQVRLATMCQANWRRYYEVRQYQEARAAVIQIQADVRRRIARLQLARLRKQRDILAIELLNVLIELAVSEARRKFAAASLIQSHWRGLLARRLRARLAEERAQQQAAIIMQKHRRRMIAVCALKAARIAATEIERHVRGLLARVARRALARRKNARGVISRAIVCIQAVVRGMLARRLRVRLRRTRAATIIERHERGRAARLAYPYRAIRRAAVQIQAMARAMLARKMYVRRRFAIIRVQAGQRAQPPQHRLAEAKYAATCIQAVTRGMQPRQMLRRAVKSVMRLQRAWRFHYAACQVCKAVQLARSHAMRIQAQQRMRIQRAKFRDLRKDWRAQRSNEEVDNLATVVARKQLEVCKQALPLSPIPYQATNRPSWSEC